MPNPLDPIFCSQPSSGNTRPQCGAKTRSGPPCRAKAVKGKVRCRMHGGLSTGPKTQAGWERVRAGHRAWLAAKSK
jgi:hypothetical protein